MVLVNIANAAVCENLNDCLTQGDWFRENKDVDSAIKYYEVACRSYSSSVGCNNVAFAYFGKQMYKESFPYAYSACLDDIGGSCSLLGYFYINGYGVEKDFFEGSVYSAHACVLGIASGCNSTANLFLNGTWYTKDYNRALAYFAKGCEYGDQDSCNLAETVKSKMKSEEETEESEE